jgi:3-isopropylmalate/(R)-2-methylmalate dehydratase small subunit
VEKTKITLVEGRGVPVRGDDIDTDRIIPARYLRCVSFDGLGEHAFEDDRQQNSEHPFNQDQYQGANILVVGENFGCGSSREHAPQSLKRWGIQAIVGKSFAEIFQGNCIALGVPCLTMPGDDVERLMAAVEAAPEMPVTVDVANSLVRFEDGRYAASIPPGAKQRFVEGTWNALAVLVQAEEAIAAKDAELPFGTNY